MPLELIGGMCSPTVVAGGGWVDEMQNKAELGHLGLELGLNLSFEDFARGGTLGSGTWVCDTSTQIGH